MIFDMSPALAEARLLATLAHFDAGPGPGYVELYQGTPPSTPGAAPTGSVLLATIVLAEPMGTVATGGPLTLAVTALATIMTSGEAQWARWYNGTSAWAGDSDVSNEAGNGFLRLETTTLFAGGKTQILGGTIG